jgi:hypothetical protein
MRRKTASATLRNIEITGIQPKKIVEEDTC